jgi:sodium-dependent dicarboxylate transporter 2/3/5
VVSWAAQELGVEIGFARWMSFGLPVVVVFLPLTWWLLCGALYRVPSDAAVDSAFAARELRALGRPGRGEAIVLTVFGLAAASWIQRPWLPVPGLSDAGIAVTAALALFVLPVDASRRIFAMDWETAVRLPWGVLILFGGGLSLAAALERNGVGTWLGASVAAWSGLPEALVIVLVVSLVILLTELTSNTATAATLVPILGGIAPGLGIPPLVLVIPAGLAASCAFMLPVATPPNAVVFGSGVIRVGDMVRAGAGLNVVGVALISLLTYVAILPILRMMGAA